MLERHNRAFKEWAVSCDAMRRGEQILLIRKGGVREEGGVFQISDSEFFLMPTYEHQNARLLKPEYLPRLAECLARERDPNVIVIDSYAVVTAIHQARDEEQVQGVARECIWNDTYTQERFNFNPYDPLYLVVLRVYRLPKPYTVSMLPEYGGCKSWVTLAEALSTEGAVPVISDAEFEARRRAMALG